MKRVAAVVTAMLLALAALPESSFTQSSGAKHPVTRADIDRWEKELTNWGRWGKDDQLGTLHLITAEKRKQAVALVKEAVSVSLARTVLTEKTADNPDPYQVEWYRSENGLSAYDRLAVAYHGNAHTHLDAMNHNFSANGRSYNGYATHKEASVKGPPGNDILNVKNGVFTRGILIDIPKLRNVPYLGVDEAIYVEDLEAWEKKANVKVSAGDAVFVRTGRWARRDALGPWNMAVQRPGLHPSVIPWLKQRDVALLGSDLPSSMRSPSLPEIGPLGNVHSFALVVLGIHLFDNCDLEELSKAAQARNRWEFLLTAAPLPVEGGTGSPINPIATF